MLQTGQLRAHGNHDQGLKGVGHQGKPGMIVTPYPCSQWTTRVANGDIRLVINTHILAARMEMHSKFFLHTARLHSHSGNPGGRNEADELAQQT